MDLCTQSMIISFKSTNEGIKNMEILSNVKLTF